jgi:hypothetical protein
MTEQLMDMLVDHSAGNYRLFKPNNDLGCRTVSLSIAIDADAREDVV